MSDHPVPPGASPLLYNEDLAPAKERTWGTYSLFAMWMQDVHAITGYTFAAGLFMLGLAGWWVLAALMIGIGIVFFLMNLTGIAGQKTGVPYPVLARISFGVFGANLPALVRAIIAIAFYGIGTYLASVAIQIAALRVWPDLDSLTVGDFLGLSPLGWICFGFMWALQLLVIRRGMETVRRFQDWAGPAIWAMMLAMAIWVVVEADGQVGLNVGVADLSGSEAMLAFGSAIALTVTYFSTLLLNFCDFSRFAPDRRSVVRGNFWGLPVNFTGFALVTVLITSGSVVVFGEAITDPVELVARIDNTAVILLGTVTFVIATIGINIVADFVSPAYDLANVAPKHIDFKRGGLISAVLSVVILPWHLFDSPVAINYFLGALGAFLGPLFGVMIVDYYLVRRGRVDVEALYSADPQGEFYYTRGWNPKAMKAYLPAAALAAALSLPSAMGDVAPFSWFVGVLVAGAVYLILTRPERMAESLIAEPAEALVTEALVAETSGEPA